MSHAFRPNSVQSQTVKQCLIYSATNTYISCTPLNSTYSTRATRMHTGGIKAYNNMVLNLGHVSPIYYLICKWLLE